MKRLNQNLLACVVWIKEVSVAIFSPTKIDSTRNKWMSMDWIGTEDASMVNSPARGSNREHWEHILPLTRKPPGKSNSEKHLHNFFHIEEQGMSTKA